MSQKFNRKISCLIAIFFIFSNIAFSQNSVLVNFGDANCGGGTPVSFSLIKDPLSAAPSVLSTCNLAAQLPDYYSVFIAYNPKNHKIYVADIRTGVTKIWVMDMALPDNISCPSSIPVLPDYTYSYVSNNFEFDNNGDLWSLSNYNPATGQCSIDQFDVNTGAVLNSRTLQFPAGNFPSAISSGDIIILPNGRMFATLGTGPSRLYEIYNYNGTSATATYLQSMPKNCFGLAYLNGELEITGFDSDRCYFYNYQISTNTLGVEQAFQNEQTPIDNTSFSPVVGTTKQLTNTVFINANTADLVYEIFVKNMGNISVNDINVEDDLDGAFGAGNVSNVSTNFVPGANAGALTLNPFYNGASVTNLLNPGQKLPNQTATNQDYFFKLQVHCRVTNLDPFFVYLNSAIAIASVGNDADGISISDSSNNGNSGVADPNNNGNPGDANENIPTPFIFGVLPVRFINIEAAYVNNISAMLKWTVATPTIDAVAFEPEFSSNGVNWQKLSHINITDPNKSDYKFLHSGLPGKIFYRVKQLDNNGEFIFSKTVSLNSKSVLQKYAVFPNPADHFIKINSSDNTATGAGLELYDAAGKLMLRRTMAGPAFQIDCSHLAPGIYVLKIANKEEVSAHKILISHR